MGLISIDILCSSCSHAWHDIVEREIQQGPHECPECGNVAGEKQISAPMVLRASYPDGNRRFSDMKEAAKLKRERAVTRKEDDRKRIASEIRSLGVKDYSK